MNKIEGCQIPCLPQIALGQAPLEPQPWRIRMKRILAKPWNYQVKPALKRWAKAHNAAGDRANGNGHTAGEAAATVQLKPLQAGDMVRVRSRPEIEAMLDQWKELKGCAFLDNMWQYCDTTQRVLKPMERFLDERDYKVKRCKGLVLLDGVICEGTPVFGRCDRCCHLFWRQEWLEKID